jgi:hypothetical protein
LCVGVGDSPAPTELSARFKIFPNQPITSLPRPPPLGDRWPQDLRVSDFSTDRISPPSVPLPVTSQGTRDPQQRPPRQRHKREEKHDAPQTPDDDQKHNLDETA